MAGVLDTFLQGLAGPQQALSAAIPAGTFGPDAAATTTATQASSTPGTPPQNIAPRGKVWVNPQTGDLSINGRIAKGDDYQSLANAAANVVAHPDKLVDTPSPGAGWQSVDPSSLPAYWQHVKAANVTASPLKHFTNAANRFIGEAPGALLNVGAKVLDEPGNLVSQAIGQGPNHYLENVLAAHPALTADHLKWAQRGLTPGEQYVDQHGSLTQRGANTVGTLLGAIAPIFATAGTGSGAEATTAAAEATPVAAALSAARAAAPVSAAVGTQFAEMSGDAQRARVTQLLSAMTPQQLAAIPQYAQLRQRGATDAQAKAMLIQYATGSAATAGAAAGVAGGALLGAAGEMLPQGLGLVARVGGRAAVGAAENVGSMAVSNVAAQAAAAKAAGVPTGNLARAATQGVGTNAAMGATLAALFGARGAPEAPINPDTHVAGDSEGAIGQALNEAGLGDETPPGTPPASPPPTVPTVDGIEQVTGAPAPAPGAPPIVPTAEGVTQAATLQQPAAPAAPPTPEAISQQLMQIDEQMTSVGKASKKYRALSLQKKQLQEQLQQLQQRAQHAPAPAPGTAPVPAPGTAPVANVGEPAAPPTEAAPDGTRPEGVAPPPTAAPAGAIDPEQVRQQAATEAARGNPMPAPDAAPAPAIPATPDAVPLPASATPTRTPKVSAPVREPTFGPEMGKPKPRFGARILQFKSDVDLALYTVANRTVKSAKDSQFMDWLRRNTGATAEQIVAAAQHVRLAVKQAVGDAQGDARKPVVVENTGAFRAMARIARPESAAVAPSPVADTIREPATDIAAQVQAVAAGEKPAVWIPAKDADTIPKKLPKGMFRVEKPEGTLLTKDAKLRARFKALPTVAESDIGAALGYAASKEDLAASPEPKRAVRVSRGKKILHEEAVNASDVGPTKARLRAQYKGARVTDHDLEAVLAERGARATAEAGTGTVARRAGKANAAIMQLAAHLHDLAVREDRAGVTPAKSLFRRLAAAAGIHDSNGAPLGPAALMRMRADIATGSAARVADLLRDYSKHKQVSALVKSLPANADAADVHGEGLNLEPGEHGPIIARAGTGRMVGRVELVGTTHGLERAAATVSKWVDQFVRAGNKFQGALRIMDHDTFVKEYGANAGVVNLTRGFAFTHDGADGQLHTVIVMRPPHDGVWTPAHVETLAHEMGHVIDYHLFDALSDAAKQALTDAYHAWRTEQSGKSASAIRMTRETPARAELSASSGSTAGGLKYALSRREWMADNIARFLLKRERADTSGPVGRYFSKVAEHIRSLWHAVARSEHMEPDLVVEQYMHDMLNEAPTLDRIVAMHDGRAHADLDGEDSADEMPRPQHEISVAEGLRAVGRGVGRGAVSSVRTLLDVGSQLARGDLDGLRKSAARARDARATRAARGIGMHASLLDYYEFDARARGMKSAPFYGQIQKLIESRNAAVGTLIKPLVAVLHYVNQIPPQARDLLQRAMYEATTRGVSIDHPWDHPRNQHLHSSDPQTEASGRAAHADGAELYRKLKQVGAAHLYSRMRDFATRVYMKELDEREKAVRELDITPEARAQETARIAGLRKAAMTGDYFPKVRDGDIIITARTPFMRHAEGDNPDKTYSTRAAASTAAEQLKAANPHADVRMSFSKEDESWSVESSVPAVWMHTSISDAEAARPQMLADLRDAWARMGYANEFDDEVKKGDMLSQPRQKTAWWRDQQAVPSSFLSQLKGLRSSGKVTPEGVQTLTDMYLRSLAESSFLKSQLRDRNVLGASKDMIQGYARRMQQAAYHLANLRARSALDTAWKGLHEAAQRDLPTHPNAVSDANRFYATHSAKADAMRDDVWNNVAGVASDLTTIGTMGLSPKYIVMQGAQSLLTTHPMLAAKIGWLKATHYLADAVGGLPSYYGAQGLKDFTDSLRAASGATTHFDPAHHAIESLVKKVARTPDEAEMLRDMHARGTLDFNWSNPIRDAMQGEQSHLRKLMRMTMAFNSAAEAFNRTLSALAVYRAGRAELKMTHGEASELANELTKKSQGNYNESNKPTFLRGVSGRTIGKFKLWTLNMYHAYYEQALRVVYDSAPGDREEGLRTLAYMTAHHAAYAGLRGLGPMYAAAQIGGWMIHHAMVAMGLSQPSTSDYKDSDTLSHDFWARVGDDMFGKGSGATFSDIMERGLLSHYLLNVSDTNGIPSLVTDKYAGIRADDSPTVKMTKFLASQLGPVYSNTVGAAANLMAGRWDAGVTHLVPANVKFLMRAANLLESGSPSGGKPVLPAGQKPAPWDLIAQGLGLDSPAVAQGYARNERIGSTQGELQAAAQRIVVAYGKNPNDPDVQARIRRFNASVPYAFQITNARLSRAASPRESMQQATLQSQDQ